MALTCQVGTVAAPTTNGGTATITLPAGTAPKRLKLFTSCRTAAGVSAGTGGDARWAEGHVTNDGGAIQQASYAFHSVDDGVSTACYRDFSDASALLITAASTTASEAVATVTTWSDTSIVLTFSTAPASAYLIGYVVWGGADIEARVLSFQLSTAVATQNVTVATGWGQPSVVMMLAQNRTTTTLVPVQGNVSVSLGVASSDTNRRESAWAEQNAAATVIAGAWQRSKLLTVTTDAVTVNAEADLSAVASWPTDGFQLAFSTQAAGAYRVIAVAMKGAFGFTLGSAATNGSAPTLSHSSTPTGVEIWSTSTVANAALDSSSTELGGWTFGASDGTNEVYAGAVNDDANTEAATGSFLKTDKAFGHWQPPASTANAPTVAGEYDASFTGSGVTLTASTVDSVAREVSYLILSSSGPVAGTYGYGDYGGGTYGSLDVAVATATLTATVASAATVPRQTQSARTATGASVSVVVKRANRTVTGTAGSAATVTAAKQAIRTLTSTAVSAASLVRQARSTRTATAANAATVARSASATRTATAPSAATAQRQTSAVRTATAASAATLVRQTARTLTGSSASAATVATARAYLRTLTATAGSAAARIAQARPTRTASAPSAATVRRDAAASRTAATGGAASRVLQPRPTRTATSAPAASVSRGRFATLTASQSAAATVARATARTLTASAATAASRTAAAARSLTATGPSAATVATVRVRLASVTAAASSAASVVRQARAARTATGTAAASRGPSTIARATTASAVTTASRALSASKRVTATAGSAATQTPQKVKLQALTAVAGSAASVVRRANAARTASSSTVASRTARAAKNLTVASSSFSAAVRSSARTLGASTSPAASVAATRARLALLSCSVGASAQLQRLAAARRDAQAQAVPAVVRQTAASRTAQEQTDATFSSAGVKFLDLLASTNLAASVATVAIRLVRGVKERIAPGRVDQATLGRVDDDYEGVARNGNGVGHVSRATAGHVSEYHEGR